MNYRHVLFDLDGTLTDPGVGITKSVQYALERMGIESDLESLKLFVGPPLQETFRERFGFSREETDRAIGYYREYFGETGIYENELYPGITELLQQLIQAGATLHVATSKPTVFAQRILEHFGISEYFHTVAGSFLDGTRTDKSEIIQSVLEDNGIAKHTAVMIGDRKHDLIGAANNAIASIGASYGYGSVEELEAHSPVAIVHTVHELAELLLASDRQSSEAVK
ncbi:HAD family hydrolase [Paenibacillus kobensis]|uniref:HAD family hydrolase n=1 Tax=Paenibacillus kobensis TaxID=59841 RepID=UPI000FD7F306|nr:HAD family hydrolase [Paenibacillus kobensis]